MEDFNTPYSAETPKPFKVERHVLKAVVDAYRAYERAEKAYYDAQDRLERCLEMAGMKIPVM